MEQYEIEECELEGQEGFFWMLVPRDPYAVDVPQDGPFDTHQEAEDNVKEYLASSTR